MLQPTRLMIHRIRTDVTTKGQTIPLTVIKKILPPTTAPMITQANIAPMKTLIWPYVSQRPVRIKRELRNFTELE